MPQLFEIQLRNDLAANWTAANTLLLAGELGFETDTGRFKLGNGTQAWTSLAYTAGPGIGSGYSLNGSRSSPNLITAAGGISVLGVQRELQFIAGNGGPVTITAVRPIAAGTAVGQELTLIGCSSSNTVTFDTATGLSTNGAIVVGSALGGGGAGGAMYLIWDGTTWNEVSRR